MKLLQLCREYDGDPITPVFCGLNADVRGVNIRDWVTILSVNIHVFITTCETSTVENILTKASAF